MFAPSDTASAVLPRPAYPGASRIVESADKRTRELAEAMLRLNAEHPEGATEATLMLEGFSTHEQREYGPTARRLANRGFVRQVAYEAAALATDEELIAAAIHLHEPLFRRLVIKLRARPDFTEDRLMRLWPKICTGLASRIARAPLPERLDTAGAL